MSAAFLKILAASLAAGAFLAATAAAFARTRTFPSALRLAGAGCLGVVVLVHAAETFRWFPGMRWGEPHSAGHYVDLTSTLLGITLFAGSYLVRTGR